MGWEKGGLYLVSRDKRKRGRGGGGRRGSKREGEVRGGLYYSSSGIWFTS